MIPPIIRAYAVNSIEKDNKMSIINYIKEDFESIDLLAGYAHNAKLYFKQFAYAKIDRITRNIPLTNWIIRFRLSILLAAMSFSIIFYVLVKVIFFEG